MEIAKKWDYKFEAGIYKKSRHVKSYRQIRSIAEGMRAYFDDNNGNFNAYKTAYALSHCQMDIGADPWHFFVVGHEFLKQNRENRPKKDTKINFFFPSQIIINAEIVEAPEKIKVNKPERKLVRNGTQVQSTITITEVMEKNIMSVPEACMSFMFRTPKNVDRHYRVKVRYQYPVKFLWFWFLWTKTEWVEGLKAHILQHECQHAQGENMYYEK